MAQAPECLIPVDLIHNQNSSSSYDCTTELVIVVAYTGGRRDCLNSPVTGVILVMMIVMRYVVDLPGVYSSCSCVRCASVNPWTPTVAIRVQL